MAQWRRFSFRVRFIVRNRVRSGLGLGLGLGIGLGVVLGSGFDYFRHCAICIAPNTESPLLG